MPEGSVLSRSRKAIFETGISLLSPKQEEQSKTLGRGRPWLCYINHPFLSAFLHTVLVYVYVRQCGKVSSPFPLETYSSVS